jgi:hypothetical protein
MDNQSLTGKSKGGLSRTRRHVSQDRQITQWSEAFIEMIGPGPVRPYWLLYARAVLQGLEVQQHPVFRAVAGEIDPVLHGLP